MDGWPGRLDPGLLDPPVEELLERLQSQLGTAHIPVLAITCRREAGLHFREEGLVADVLRKPPSGVHPGEAVERIVARQEQLDAEATRLEQERQLELILRLIVEGPDPPGLSRFPAPLRRPGRRKELDSCRGPDLGRHRGMGEARRPFGCGAGQPASPPAPDRSTEGTGMRGLRAWHRRSRTAVRNNSILEPDLNR